MPVINLKSGREKSLLRRHPWIFSGAIEDIQGNPAEGETVEIRSSRDEFLAWAAFSPHSQIRARVWAWEYQTNIDAGFFRVRLQRAISARQGLFQDIEDNALRLVHAESDGLPGLIVDRYDQTLVVQFLSSGAEFWRDTLVNLLVALTGAESVYERSDVDVRQLEGLAPRSGLLRGNEPAEYLEISENGLRFWVDVRQGHKTGYYLDQRTNRARIRGLAKGCDVLDCFSYSGGFTTNALTGGANSVLAVDASAEANELALKNVVLNRLPVDRVAWQQGDVFQVLRGLRDRRRSFDLIVLDPPKFAQTASQAKNAARGYKDINLLAFKLLRSGGILATFSCSGGVSEELFQMIVAGAALDAGVEAQIVERLHQGADHPVALNFPEGSYLKGLVIRVA